MIAFYEGQWSNEKNYIILDILGFELGTQAYVGENNRPLSFRTTGQSVWPQHKLFTNYNIHHLSTVQHRCKSSFCLPATHRILSTSRTETHLHSSTVHHPSYYWQNPLYLHMPHVFGITALFYSNILQLTLHLRFLSLRT